MLKKTTSKNRPIKRSGQKVKRTSRRVKSSNELPLLIKFNKPFNTLCQFTGEAEDTTLAHYIDIKSVYPAGRLDKDSEGLLLLTNDGKFQNKISNPKFKMPKTYWVQVEGEITEEALNELRQGVLLKDGMTKPAQAKPLPTEIEASLWERTPPVRYRKNIPTSWFALTIREGKNRQVRRMTAAVGYPTLRLIRVAIGPWSIDTLKPGKYLVEHL